MDGFTYHGGMEEAAECVELICVVWRWWCWLGCSFGFDEGAQELAEDLGGVGQVLRVCALGIAVCPCFVKDDA